MGIPPILHQIWFGAPPHPFLQECRKSVIKMHPHFEHRYHKAPTLLSHSEVKKFRFNQMFAKCRTLNKKHSPFALQADIYRLIVIYLFGGFYLDHDMYAIRPLDIFCSDDLVMTCIRPNYVGEGVIAAPPRSPKIAEIMNHFSKRPVIERNVCMDLTKLCKKNDWPVYPQEVFVPHARRQVATHKYVHSPQTHTIHCWREKPGYPYDLKELKTIQENSRPCIQKPATIKIERETNESSSTESDNAR